MKEKKDAKPEVKAETENELENKKSKTALWVAIAVVAIIVIVLILFILFGNKKTYSVKFDSNGGNVTTTIEVKDGKLVEEPDEPTRENYKFLGWYLDDEEFDFSTPITKNMRLVAKWEKIDEDEEKKIYNVKFDSGSSIESAKTDENGYIKELSTPEREGYRFLGWYLGEEKFDFSKPVTKNMILVAKWEKEDTEEETKPTNSETTNANTDSNKKPTTSGSTSSGGTSSTSKPSQGGTTTTPQVKNYTVTFTVDGKRVQQATVSQGSKITLPTTPTKAGYTFKGWYSGNKVVSANTTVNGNMNIVGQWDTYTFKVETIGSDTESVNKLVTVYKNGSAVIASSIYGNLDENGNVISTENPNYNLGNSSSHYNNKIRIVSKYQFEHASNFMVSVNGNKVHVTQG